MSARRLTQQRRRTHGEWAVTARITQGLKRVFDSELADRQERGQQPLGEARREALDGIAVKIARIISGDPDHPDHWDDIGGFADLGKDGRS